MGVAQQLLDHDGFHSLFQEEGGRRVAEVVEPNAPEPGLAEERGGLRSVCPPSVTQAGGAQ
ncbi:Putative phage integrase [Streptomyces venezuelae]|nr:Putative phage integrase [Streptomyces venezuelae]